MNFFKSVFPSDPDPSDPPEITQEHPSPSPSNPVQQDENGRSADPSPFASSASGAWSFGGLIKSIATKSESVIQTYRRDLEEFGSGLKMETAIITEAIKELPGSLEVGASVAQESLESVGQAIDEFGNSVWRGTAEIISQGKDALLTDLDDGDSSDAQSYGNSGSKSAVRYSRFEAQVCAIQSDPNTYCDEPEDSEDFHLWRKGFSLEEKADEIGNLAADDGIMEGVYRKLVPSVVDHETFWSRYFYKVHKLKLVEDARVNLVKRAISGEDEEELSWEVDEEEETEGRVENTVLDDKEMIRSDKIEDAELVAAKKLANEESAGKRSNAELTDVGSSSESVNNAGPVEKAAAEGGLAAQPGTSDVSDKNAPVDESTEFSGALVDGGCIVKADEKASENKMDPGESSKDNSDFSVVSSQPSFHEEDDLGWDEIEDLGSGDEKKIRSSGGSPSKIDLRKRLSARDEDEDLSWDIEDEDPPKQ